MAESNTPAPVPEKKRKTWIRRILIGLIVFAVVLVLFLIFLLNWTVAEAVRHFAPDFTGTPVKLESVNINVFTGRVRLNGFKVANPQGFVHPYAFSLDDFALDVDMATVFSKKIVIENITVKGMLADYELGLNGSNLAQIQRNAEAKSGKAPEKEKASASADETDSGRKIVVRQLRVSEMQLAMGAVKLPLPPISMDNLGDGCSIREVVTDFYVAMMKSVASVVSSQTILETGKAAKEIGLSVKDTGKKTLNSFKKMFQ